MKELNIIYETIDGNIYKNKEEAIAHELMYCFTFILGEIKTTKGDIFSFFELVKIIESNRAKELLNIIEAYVNVDLNKLLKIYYFYKNNKYALTSFNNEEFLGKARNL